MEDLRRTQETEYQGKEVEVSVLVGKECDIVSLKEKTEGTGVIPWTTDVTWVDLLGTIRDTSVGLSLELG